jgi:hypothetical protein
VIFDLEAQKLVNSNQRLRASSGDTHLCAFGGFLGRVRDLIL